MPSAPRPKTVLRGDRSAIERLVRGPLAPWIALVDHLLEEPEPAPAFVRVWWDLEPDIEAWRRRLKDAMAQSERVTTIAKARRVIDPWLRNSVESAFAASHEAVKSLQGGKLRAKKKATAKDTDAAAEALLAKIFGRDTADDYDFFAGEDPEGATRTSKRSTEFANAKGRPKSERAQLAAWLESRDWDSVLEHCDRILVTRGLPFGTGGFTMTDGEPDPRSQAIDEARMIVEWASPTTPEWVRALGGLALAFDDDPAGERLWARYRAGLERLVALPRAIDELEVVIRQLRERNLSRPAVDAARKVVEVAPDDSLARSVLANLLRTLGDPKSAYEQYVAAARILEAKGSDDAGRAWASAGGAAADAGDDEAADEALEASLRLARDDQTRRAARFYRAQSLRTRDPEQARTLADALFREVSKDARTLVETEIGPAVADLWIDLLLAAGDARAIVAQQALVDAKRSLWGECPAAWLEEHNLGTVHARLGNSAKGRKLVEGALARMLPVLGERDPSVEMCRRTLAQLDRS